MRIPTNFRAVPGAILGLVVAAVSIEAAAAQTVIAVDLFGNRAVASEAIREVVAVEVGQPLQVAPADIEKAVMELDGVVKAKVWPISMGDTMALFVGIEETEPGPSKLRPRPTRDIRLPPEVVDAYDRAMGQLEAALLSGQGREDTADGHSLSHYAPMREQQERFLDYSEEYFLELIEVLRESKFDHERAVAATVLAYVEDKSEVIEELQYAANDIDSTVRNNATRALSILAEYSYDHPELGIAVNPEPFLDLLDSPIWTDRNKGSAVIAAISQSRDPALMEQLRQRSLPSLFEMAAWKSLGHASFSISTLGRIAGIPEEEIAKKRSQIFANEDGVHEAWLQTLRDRISALEQTAAPN